MALNIKYDQLWLNMAIWGQSNQDNSLVHGANHYQNWPFKANVDQVNQGQLGKPLANQWFPFGDNAIQAS